MALLVRAVWGVGTGAMVFAGPAWGLLPDLLTPFAFGHGAQFMAACLIPAVLLGVHMLFATLPRLAPFAVPLAVVLLAVDLGTSVSGKGAAVIGVSRAGKRRTLISMRRCGIMKQAIFEEPSPSLDSDLPTGADPVV